MKHTDIPVKKNDELSITIDAVGSEGQGVGRVNGYAIFVPGALAGETVRTHIIKVTASYAVGKLLEVSVPSPDRVQPSCPAYPACGGCSLQHLDYAAQLRLKQRFVSDALTRLGGFREIAVQPTLGMDTPWRYRNKGSFPLAAAEHGVAFGFFRPRSHTLVPLADCPIQDERIVSVARRVSEWATAYRISAYDESTHRGILRHVMARVTTTGECMAVIVTTGKLPHEAELLALLQDVDSVYHNINDRDTNVIFGTSFRLLAFRRDRRTALFRGTAVVFTGKRRADSRALRRGRPPACAEVCRDCRGRLLRRRYDLAAAVGTRRARDRH